MTTKENEVINHSSNSEDERARRLRDVADTLIHMHENNEVKDDG